MHESGADASKQDATLPDSSVIEAAPDVSPADFCTGGQPKIEVAGNLYVSPTLTTSPLIMDCCEGVVVRFHLEQQLGYNISVVVRGFGNLPVGAYVLGDEPGGLEVSARKESGLQRMVSGDRHPARGRGLSSRRGWWDSVCKPRQETCCLRFACTYLRSSSLPMTGKPGGACTCCPIRRSARMRRSSSRSAASPLAAAPIVNLMSIAYYEQSTNKAVWDDWSTTQGLLNSLPQVGVYGLPFVMVAGGERIYVGAFTTPVSSVLLDAPSIDTSTIPEDGFSIQAPPQAADPRLDPRILKTLGEATKLAP